MTEVELHPELFTADAIGAPGERKFYLRAEGDFGVHTLLIEKEQVAVLAGQLRELLVTIDRNDAVVLSTAERDPALSFEEEPEAEARVGTMGFTYDEDTDRVVLIVEPIVSDDEPSGEGLRFVLRRDQVRAFVLHCLAIVAEGRPICRMCALPIDPEGHDCPAANGHRREQ